jgi:hypothetical protein
MRLAVAIVLFCLHESWAQSVQTRMGAQAAAMGWSNVAVSGTWSAFANPAAFANEIGGAIGTAKEVTRHLPGANRIGAFGSFRFSKSALSATMFSFGDALYSEQALAVSAGHQIGITRLGLRANWWQYQAEGFGTQRALSFDFGGLIELAPSISVGALITNLSQASLRNDELLPTRLAVGVLYQPSERALATAEIEKDLLYTPTFRGGFEYNFKSRIFFRTGFQINPQIATGGIGYRTGALSIDYALQYSFQLLLTHQVSAQIRWGRKTRS